MKKILGAFFRSIIFVPALELVCAIAGQEVYAFICTIGWVGGMGLFAALHPDKRVTFKLRWSAINAILTNDRAFVAVLNKYDEGPFGLATTIKLDAGAHWINWPKAIKPETVAEIYSEAALQNEIENLTGGKK
jgi:hypothetical protein